MKSCPFCKVEMFRPRHELVKNAEDEKGELFTITNPYKVADSMFEYRLTESKYGSVKYKDFMCPECNIVLFYGEKNLK